LNNEHQLTTRGKKHWGCSGSVNILPRPSISNGGYERSPFTPTISYRQPLERIKKKYSNINDFFIILVKKEKMKTSDIRNNFHSLIDRIENDPLLMKFYDLMIKSTSTKEGQLYKQLTDEQKNVLLLAEEESNDPANLISYNQQKKKHQKWL